MKEHPIRLLTAREIDCRISQVKDNGIQLLLYKDARVDMAILDETFGPMNWQRHHTRNNANCIISIYDDDKGCWVDKEDVGTESNTEAQKGLASDSFKRAGVNWGIGRELYTAPFIWIDKANCEIKQDTRNPNRLMCYDRFEVSDIGYNDQREINRLVIINSKTRNVVYEMGKSRPKSESKPKSEPKSAPKQEPANPSGMAPLGTPATEEQKAYIRQHDSDEEHMDTMQEYGAELERLPYNDAVQIIKEIDRNNTDQTPKCERCNKIITGVALPDGSTMTASELIGKSKITYNGVYCFECMKILNRKRKAG